MKLAIGAYAMIASAALAVPHVWLDPNVIGKAPVTNWTTFNGDYSGQRYSTLTQIGPGNVGQLAQMGFQDHESWSAARCANSCNQMHSSVGQRSALHHDSGSYVGSGCADGKPAVAL